MKKTTSTEHLSDYELAKLITNDLKKIENSINALISYEKIGFFTI